MMWVFYLVAVYVYFVHLLQFKYKLILILFNNMIDSRIIRFFTLIEYIAYCLLFYYLK